MEYKNNLCHITCTCGRLIQNLLSNPNQFLLLQPQYPQNFNYIIHNIEMLVKQANTFRSIDDILQNNKDPTILSQLFEKKKKLLFLVESGKLTADKYALICKKTMADATVEEIKNSAQFQLVALGDDVGDWFKEVIDETKDKLDDQKKLMSKLGIKSIASEPVPKQQPQKIQKKPSLQQQQPQKPPPKQVQQPRQQQLPKPPQKQPQTSPKPPQKQPQPIRNTTTPTLDITKIYSLKVLDSFMQDNSSNKHMYMNLFEQKQKILQLIKQKKLNAQMYYQTVDKLSKSGGNQDVVFSAQMELDQLKEFHQGNVDKWFKDRVDQAQQSAEIQNKKYSVFKTGKAPPPTRSTKDFQIDLKVQQIAIDISQRVKKSNLAPNTKLFCFKYLDEEMQKNSENKKIFCELYEQKLKYIQMLKNQQITAQGYRDILAKIIEESTNQDLKSAAEMEVDLHDITGDVMEFFQSCVDETGAKYQEQEKIYNQFMGGKGAKLNLQNRSSVKKQAELPKIEKQPKPDISQIVSFTVLVTYLEKYKKDYDYCTELKEKGSKLMKLVQQKKLQPKQYMKFLQNKIQTSKNRDTIKIMRQQFVKFQVSKDPVKLFKTIVGEYIDKVKINLGNRDSYDSEVYINEMTINQAAPNIKIQYLLRKLGKHQCLLVYYKKNNLTNHLKLFQKSYKEATKNTLQLCQKIKNKDIKDIDLHEFADHNLPNITFSVLNRQSRTNYNQKLAVVIEKIKKSSIKIAQYVKTLKKGTNKNNVDQGNKMIDKNNKMITYLESLINEDFVPFPDVQETKLEMYNMDLNKNLTQNQIQIKVVNIDGLKDHLLLRIYMIDRKHHRFEANVADGVQKNIETIIKIPPQIMEEIIKGTDKRYLYFTLVSKGWFADKTVGEADLELNFIRNNRMQEKIVMKQDKIFMDVIINVLKPKKPTVTQIPVIKLTQYPKYEHNPFIQKQFIKTIMPFEKPTKSELRSA